MLAGDYGTSNAIHMKGGGQRCSQEGIKKKVKMAALGAQLKPYLFILCKTRLQQGEVMLIQVLKFVQG